MADLISRIKGKPSSNVELRLERGWSVLSSALAVSEAGVGASLPNVTTHPPTKQSLGGMESMSARSISQHMASLEAKMQRPQTTPTPLLLLVQRELSQASRWWGPAVAGTALMGVARRGRRLSK
jgi:hypothetical protein